MPDANLTARSIFSKCVCMLNDLSNTIITRTTKKTKKSFTGVYPYIEMENEEANRLAIATTTTKTKIGRAERIRN